VDSFCWSIVDLENTVSMRRRRYIELERPGGKAISEELSRKLRKWVPALAELVTWELKVQSFYGGRRDVSSTSLSA
jgi:hypothetical protein